MWLHFRRTRNDHFLVFPRRAALQCERVWAARRGTHLRREEHPIWGSRWFWRETVRRDSRQAAALVLRSSGHVGETFGAGSPLRRLRAAEKKLRQIAELKEWRGGKRLDEGQVLKLQGEKALAEEIAAMKAMIIELREAPLSNVGKDTPQLRSSLPSHIHHSPFLPLYPCGRCGLCGRLDPAADGAFARAGGGGALRSGALRSAVRSGAVRSGRQG